MDPAKQAETSGFQFLVPYALCQGERTLSTRQGARWIVPYRNHDRGQVPLGFREQPLIGTPLRHLPGFLLDLPTPDAHASSACASALIVYPLRLGTQERWRQLFQDIARSRREQFGVFCRQVGISQVQAWLVQLRRSELLLMRLHAQEPQQDLLITWPDEHFDS